MVTQNFKVDVPDLKDESLLFKDWGQILRGQLEPVWHRIGFHTRQLITDINVLRKLLTYVTLYKN